LIAQNSHILSNSVIGLLLDVIISFLPKSGTAVANSTRRKKENAMSKIRTLKVAKGEKGFTLIEVLVAMIVLAIGILGLAPMLVISMQGNQFSREITEATYLAQDRLEQLRNQTVISPIPYSEYSFSLNGEYTRTVDVSDRNVDNSIPPGVYRMTVNVSWIDKDGKSHSSSYISYKAK